MNRTPTSRGAERSRLGPQWKTEARGVWRLDFRIGATAPNGVAGLPTVLRVRETRTGYSWELWRGPSMVQAGEAGTADEAGDYAEFAANTAATPGAARRSQPEGAPHFEFERSAPTPSPGLRIGMLLIIALAWFANLTALWLGVGLPVLTALSLVATLWLLYLIVVQRIR
jgi:hypothetical protein